MTPQQLKAMKRALEALKLLTDTEQTFGALDYGDNAITALEEVLADHAMREVQRLGQEIEPDDIASILACRDVFDAQPVPPRTWVGSGDLEDSNAYLTPPQRTHALMQNIRNYLVAAADGSMSRNNSEQLASELLQEIDARGLKEKST